MENLELYKRFSPVPETAKKKITGGKLNGKTDINPMWRIKTLTETFGACGFGWTTKVVDRWVEQADGESAAWVLVELKVRDPQSGMWSEAIQGMGGSKQNGKGMGDGINDEAFKMAETDAISVCCKKLGMGADVYWEADKTKYSATATKPTATATATATVTEKKKPVIEEGNPLWDKAIDYCVKKNIPASELASNYAISAEAIKKMQNIIDMQK